jgi:hypothetical protein
MLHGVLFNRQKHKGLVEVVWPPMAALLETILAPDPLQRARNIRSNLIEWTNQNPNAERGAILRAAANG